MRYAYAITAALLAGGAAADQKMSPGRGDLFHQVRRVVGPVGQQQHPLAQQRDQLAGQRHLAALALAADDSAEQPAGAGLG